MTIKGTLETFNLLDLLQMLAFNQKVGTLLLETAGGPRTLFVDSGQFGFVQGDPSPSHALARVLRRTNVVPADRLGRGLKITANSGKYLGDALTDLGAIEADERASRSIEAMGELFFDLLQTSISRFEFIEGKRLAPDGKEGAAILPLCAVDAVLLELTRKIDEWTVLRAEIPADEEVYEASAVQADTCAVEQVPEWLPPRVLPLLDGQHTVTAVVERSDGDRLSVMRYLAGLLRQGVAQLVSTSDLARRADVMMHRRAPADAVPLLRRAIDRGDGEPHLRLKLADALEASGDPVGAAAELDTFATTFEGADPVATFEALHRVLGLRDGEPAAAARVCDHYLRWSARLRDRSGDAAEALRSLVHGATSHDRPADAADRLAQFIEKGEAPAEDLLVLADLYASAGRHPDAANALVKRAEGLIHAGRPGPARELLRRAIGYDTTRLDVRRRLADLEGADRRRRHRRRVTVLLSLIGLVAGTALAVYMVYDGRAARSTEETLSRADDATHTAEIDLQKAVAAWGKAVDAVAQGTVLEGGLQRAAANLRVECERIAGGLKGTIGSATGDLSRRSVNNHVEAGLERLHLLELRAQAIAARPAQAVREAGERAERALAEGEKAYGEGRFRDARPWLLTASRLSFEDEARAARARKGLDGVDGYVAGFTRARAEFDRLAATPDTDATWRVGCQLIATFLDSDLTREILLPVPVLTVPPGSTLRIGPNGAFLSAPTTLRYSPFGDVDLRVRAPGHTPAVVTLPSFRAIRDGERTGGLPPFRVSVALPEGARWIVPAARVSAGPFAVGDAVWFALPDGTLASLRAADGMAGEARGLPALGDKARGVGRTTGGLWALSGLRTFIYVPEGASPWQFVTAGRLAKPPAFAGGVLLLTDDTGMAYSLDAMTGASHWKASLPGPPVQPPYGSSLGFVVATAGGESSALGLQGELSLLAAPEAGKATLVVPWKDGGVLLIGGTPGLRKISSARVVKPLGTADPDGGLRATLTREGVLWVEKSGRVRCLPADDAKPAFEVKGLDLAAAPVIEADGTVYVVGRDGVLRGARLEAPDVTLWQVKLLGKPLSEPIVSGDLLLVRTDLGIYAYER